MPRQTLDKGIAPGAYAYDGVNLPLTAAIVADKEQFVSTGRELVIAFNSSADTEYNIIINSSVDEHGRTKNVTDAIPFGEYHVYGPFPRTAWAQSDGMITLEADNAAIKWLVVQLP